jgi:hypothetical protein
MASLKVDVDALEKFTTETLAGLQQPIEETDKRLQPGTWSDDREMTALAEVKGFILAVKDNSERIEVSLDKSKCTIAYLKKLGRNVGPLAPTLKQAAATWNAILELIPGLEDTMKPLLKKNGVKIRAMIATFRATLDHFKVQVDIGSGYKEYAVGFAPALGVLAALLTRHGSEQERCDKMLVLANAFNCPREMGEALGVLASIKQTLLDFTALWETDKEVRNYMEMATEMQWADLDPGGLDDLGLNVLNKAKRCPDSTMESGAYRGLQEHARRFFVVCPLVVAFTRPSFQPRHWQELLLLAFPDDDAPLFRRSLFKLPSQDPGFVLHEFFHTMALYE